MAINYRWASLTWVDCALDSHERENNCTTNTERGRERRHGRLGLGPLGLELKLHIASDTASPLCCQRLRATSACCSRRSCYVIAQHDDVEDHGTKTPTAQAQLVISSWMRFVAPSSCQIRTQTYMLRNNRALDDKSNQFLADFMVAKIFITKKLVSMFCLNILTTGTICRLQKVSLATASIRASHP